MSFDLIQWHHPFWGMFQVQCVVYASCFLALMIASVMKPGGLSALRSSIQGSKGMLACSMIVTVIANLLSAVVFEMNTPLPLVLLESAGVLCLSVAGLFRAFSPFLHAPSIVSDMQPEKIN